MINQIVLLECILLSVRTILEDLNLHLLGIKGKKETDISFYAAKEKKKSLNLWFE